VKTAVVTGACGFIGGHLLGHLQAAGWRIKVLARDAARLARLSGRDHGLTALAPELDLHSSQAAWSRALENADAVFHLAGIAHRRANLEELTRVNERSPAMLARAAGAAGVPGFVWLSSIKVLGETSSAPLPVTAPPAPADPYAASKAAAERLLQTAASEHDSRICIVRPPLVYGVGVKANFLALLALARLGQRGIPLPLGQARAPRSLLGVTNLCDFLVRAALAGRGLLHVADAEDLCVAQVLELLSQGQKIRLLNVPERTMQRGLALLGRRQVYQRLFQPLQLDTRSSFADLNWRPPADSAVLLNETMAWYRQR
jgi:UDP-glucose 4-epimerase